jgi:hypothetical protein
MFESCWAHPLKPGSLCSKRFSLFRIRWVRQQEEFGPTIQYLHFFALPRGDTAVPHRCGYSGMPSPATSVPAAFIAPPLGAEPSHVNT